MRRRDFFTSVLASTAVLPSRSTWAQEAPGAVYLERPAEGTPHKDKVLLNVLFRGRELQHIDEGRRIITHMVAQLAEHAKIEKAPSMEGKRMTAMLAPKS